MFSEQHKHISKASEQAQLKEINTDYAYLPES